MTFKIICDLLICLKAIYRTIALHLTTAQLCQTRPFIFATKAHIDNRKKLVKQQYILHMSSEYGELRPTNGWDLFGSLGYPSRFQWVLRIGFVTAAISLTGGQQNFAGSLAVSWAGTLYIHFWALLASNGILPAVKCTLHPILPYRTALDHHCRERIS